MRMIRTEFYISVSSLIRINLLKTSLYILLLPNKWLVSNYLYGATDYHKKNNNCETITGLCLRILSLKNESHDDC